jgi:hypothetical protein
MRTLLVVLFFLAAGGATRDGAFLLSEHYKKILWFMTVDFRHESSKFRHKTTSMTKFEKVMY